MAAARDMPVVTTYCESHTSDVPFYAVAQLLRNGIGIQDLDAPAARARVHDSFTAAEPDDLLLLNDLLGIRDPAEMLPEIAPEARRRRLTALIIAASLAQPQPTLNVIEDAHWIDEISESMLAEFLAVIPRTSSMVLITYRPEYRGALSRLSGAQTLALRPLSRTHAATLTTELLGTDPSLDELAERVAARAAGNPFFAEEMVRDLAERGVLLGQPGAYQLHDDVSEVDVPATLQAAIGARIDRLDATAKQTLNAAAVVGSRFDEDLLTALTDNADVAPLIEAELVDQVSFTTSAEYAFHHPLVRTVAYESQLKSDRVMLHRRLANVIEARESPDQYAALIAEHFEAAGDLHAAFGWHMRAGAWSIFRDVAAAYTSWRRARQTADLLPEDDPDRTPMRIAPRTLLCATGHTSTISGAETGFETTRPVHRCRGSPIADDIATAGRVFEQYFNSRRAEASRTCFDLIRLLESISDPT